MKLFEKVKDIFEQVYGLMEFIVIVIIYIICFLPMIITYLFTGDKRLGFNKAKIGDIILLVLYIIIVSLAITVWLVTP